MNPLFVRPQVPAALRRGAVIAGIALAIVAVPVAGAAQEAQPCESASARLTGRALPFVGSSAWNDWVTLTGCGTRGATIVSGLLQSSVVRDENELGRLDHLTGLLDGWFQPSLISAYQALAQSSDASPAIRLRAMWLLAGLYAPSVDVATPLQNYTVGRCESTARTTALRDFPGSLPEGAYDRVLGAYANAAADMSAPERVRATARCWQGVVRDQVANDANAAPAAQPDNPDVVESTAPTPVEHTVFYPAQQDVIVEEPIRVQYECGDRFVFYNEFGTEVAVHWSNVGTSYGGVLRVTRGGPFVFAGARVGPIRFWVGEREIAYYNTWYRPCGSRVLLVAQPVYPWYGWHAGLGIVVWPTRRVYGSPRYVAPRYVAPRYVAPRAAPRYVPERGQPPRHEGGTRYAQPAPQHPRQGDESRRNPRGNDGQQRGSVPQSQERGWVPPPQERGSVPTQRTSVPQDRGSVPQNRVAQPRGGSREESGSRGQSRGNTNGNGNDHGRRRG